MKSKLNKRISRLLENTADLSLKRKARRILTELNPKTSDRILDVGCGDGYYILLASQLEKIFGVGLEYDAKNLLAAERNFSNLKIKYKKVTSWEKNIKKGIYLIEGDIVKMPFEDNFFDKVVMSEVAEHLPDDLAGLKEVYRCMKKEGILLLTVPNKNYPFLWDPVNWVSERLLNFHFKSGFLAGIWNQHLRLYSKDEIVSVVKKAGFKIKILEVQTRWCLPFNHYLINLGARLLAGNKLSKQFARQANKFEHFDVKKRSSLIKLYYALAEFADGFNGCNHPSTGTTIFIKAYK
ncbi:methyltransferase domain-containing protein [Candidatus Daviesbacteria bacterium]|nr:methyltransferase domain-containing protein [Candidatus Daviesbacteria bacterium]